MKDTGGIREATDSMTKLNIYNTGIWKPVAYNVFGHDKLSREVRQAKQSPARIALVFTY